MSRLDELERRITAVEERQRMECGLRASLDRDFSNISERLSAQQRSIQALATTQSEHTAMLVQHAQKLDRHEAKLDRHETSLTAAHGKLDLIITMLDGLTT